MAGPRGRGGPRGWAGRLLSRGADTQIAKLAMTCMGPQPVSYLPLVHFNMPPVLPCFLGNDDTTAAFPANVVKPADMGAALPNNTFPRNDKDAYWLTLGLTNTSTAQLAGSSAVQFAGNAFVSGRSGCRERRVAADIRIHEPAWW